MEFGASEGAQSPALGIQNLLHIVPWERGYQPPSREKEDGGNMHGDWSQREIRDSWARLLGSHSWCDDCRLPGMMTGPSK
jgi:hypothetical protein